MIHRNSSSDLILSPRRKDEAAKLKLFTPLFRMYLSILILFNWISEIMTFQIRLTISIFHNFNLLIKNHTVKIDS